MNFFRNITIRYGAISKKGFRAFVKEVWPNHSLRPLEKTHPVFSTIYKLDTTYSLEGKELFSAQIGAGSFEVAMRMDARERDRLLASGRLGLATKRALKEARSDADKFPVRFAVKNRGDVAAIAKLIMLRSRMGLEKQGHA